MARSIENVADSLAPLANGEEEKELDLVRNAAIEISTKLSKLYRGVARKAFGEDNQPGVVR